MYKDSDILSVLSESCCGEELKGGDVPPDDEEQGIDTKNLDPGNIKIPYASRMVLSNKKQAPPSFSNTVTEETHVFTFEEDHNTSLKKRQAKVIQSQKVIVKK